MEWFATLSILGAIFVCVSTAPFKSFEDDLPDIFYDLASEEEIILAEESRFRRSPQILYDGPAQYGNYRNHRRYAVPDRRYPSGPVGYGNRRPSDRNANGGGFGGPPISQSSSQSNAQALNTGGLGGSSVNTHSQSFGGGQATASGGAQSFNSGPGGASSSAANAASSAGGIGGPASATAGAQSFNQNPTFPVFGGGGFSGSAANAASSVGKK